MQAQIQIMPLTKRVKVQHEKKPISNSKSMQIVRFEQTSVISLHEKKP